MIKRTRLAFKGEKTPVSNTACPSQTNSCRTNTSCDDEKFINKWLPTNSSELLVGPIWLTAEIGSTRHSFSFSETGAVSIIPLSATDAQPLTSSQVVVGQYIGDKEHFAMKTSHGRYIGYDKHGFIETTKEAVGPYETWKPIFFANEGCVIFKRQAADYFLQYDQKSQCLRADVEEQDEATKFYVFYQSSREAYLAKAAEKFKLQKIRSVLDPSSYEDDQMKRYVSWYEGDLTKIKNRAKLPALDLNNAEAKGQLHSILLDRREKLKSDKYCK